MPVVRVGAGRGAHRRLGRRRRRTGSRAAGLTEVDALLRPACEAALQVAREGVTASPPIPPPRPLRALLGFARLSDSAVAKVRRLLDRDDELRARVWAALEDDPRRQQLGRPSVLFLARPEGWEAELEQLAAEAATAARSEAAGRADASAARRLAAVELALARTEDELEALQETAAGLRADLADARRARRTATSDVGRLRKRIAELEAAAAALPHPAGEAEAEAAALRARVADAAARAARAEERATRAEAEAALARAGAERAVAADATPPSPAAVPGVAPVDHQAVAEAVSAAVAAISSLADALGRAAAALSGVEVSGPGWPPDDAPAAPAPSRSSAPPDVLPTTGRVPVELPPATFEDTAAALDHLLRTPRALVFVDGYNVTLSTRGELALADQRRWLLDAAAAMAARTGAELHVVFDGEVAGGSGGDLRRRLGVRVRFTAPDVEADDEILALVAGLPAERPAVVVSDDRRVREGARRLGANVVGVAALVEAFRRAPS